MAFYGIVASQGTAANVVDLKGEGGRTVNLEAREGRRSVDAWKCSPGVFKNVRPSPYTNSAHVVIGGLEVEKTVIITSASLASSSSSSSFDINCPPSASMREKVCLCAGGGGGILGPCKTRNGPNSFSRVWFFDRGHLCFLISQIRSPPLLSLAGGIPELRASADFGILIISKGAVVFLCKTERTGKHSRYKSKK